MRAQKLIKKAKESVDAEQSCKKIAQIASQIQDGNDASGLFGELLFECAKLGNIKKIDLEQALYDKNDDFCAKKRKN